MSETMSLCQKLFINLESLNLLFYPNVCTVECNEILCKIKKPVSRPTTNPNSNKEDFLIGRRTWEKNYNTTYKRALKPKIPMQCV